MELCFEAIYYYTYGSTYSRNGPYVPYMQYKINVHVYKVAVEST